ncbi:MAG TPA: hypothetical protein ENH27_02010, partial [Rhizobiales bacterium]|nr:hypothetical protein [Hyphomicrobiales bacterium]
MGNHSRYMCERHRWAKGAFDHWAGAWPFKAFQGAGTPRAGGPRLAFFVLVALMSALLLGAVGAVAEAGTQTIKFNDNSKVQRMRIPVDKSDTIRLERPFTEALVGDSEIADVIPLTNQSLYVLGKKVGATRLTILGESKTVLGIIEIEISYDVAG